MAKYKVLKPFRDTHTKEVYKSDEEILLTDERAEEVKENLKAKGEFIELIETPNDDEFNREEAKNKLKELGVEFNGNAKNDDLKQLLEDQEGGE